MDPAAVLTRKEKVVGILRGGLEKACARLKVRLCTGHGRVLDARHVEVTMADGSSKEVEELTRSYRPGRSFSLTLSYKF